MQLIVESQKGHTVTYVTVNIALPLLIPQGISWANMNQDI